MAGSTQNKLIVSTMRDEAPYILEWVAYHRVIGFTDFLIYTNDCRDGTDLLLDRLQQNGIVRHERNQVLRRGPHKSALKYAKEHAAYAEADWVYVCDVDEFLNIRLGDGHVDELIARFPEADAIPVAWRLFTASGQTELFPGASIEAFVDAEPESPETDKVGRFVKSLFKRHDAVERMGLHGPKYDEDFAATAQWGARWMEVDPKADPERPAQDFGYEIAQINHYAVRSLDAFMIKRNRGRANHVHQTIGQEYWDRWSRGGEEDRSIQRHWPAVEAELARLRADPIVAQLEIGARQFQQNLLDEILRDPDAQAVRASILATMSDQPSVSAPAVLPEVTAELEVKAPKRHQNRLKMLSMMPKGGRCAEIGVWNGGFSGAILSETVPSELVLIDPWDLLSGQGETEWTHKKHENHLFMQGMFDNVTALYGALPNVVIRKGFSADVLASFEDDYFDWVYIDGNHLYEFVCKDMELAFQKVRPGGIIAGDDFFWKRDGRMHVREAVLDTMRAQGMKNRPTRIGQQFMIEVPAR